MDFPPDDDCPHLGIMLSPTQEHPECLQCRREVDLAAIERYWDAVAAQAESCVRG